METVPSAMAKSSEVAEGEGGHPDHTLEPSDRKDDSEDGHSPKSQIYTATGTES